MMAKPIQSLALSNDPVFNNIKYLKVKYDRPGECSPEKDCLR